MPRPSSLKVISRPGTETLYIRGTVRGVTVFRSAGTNNRRLAEEKRAALEAELFREAVHGPALTKRQAPGFGQAVQEYLDAGKRSPSTQRLLLRLLDHFGDTPCDQIDQLALEAAYKTVLRTGATASSKKRLVLTPLRAVLNRASRVHRFALIPFEAPPVPRGEVRHVHALLPEQVHRLVQAAQPYLRPLLVVGFATGCRPAELFDLNWGDINLEGARMRVVQKQEGRIRHVDLPPVAVAALELLPWREGAVFRPGSPAAGHSEREGWKGYADRGRESGGQIKRAWATACRLAGLPGRWREWKDKRGVQRSEFVSDHTPYVWRHTWASWHYAVHRDLKLLAAEGDWSSSSIPDRTYTKLIPRGYEKEILSWRARDKDWVSVQYPCNGVRGREKSAGKPQNTYVPGSRALR